MTFHRHDRTLHERREAQIHEAMTSLAVGEVAVLPWGERVKLMPEGVREHLMPLGETQMRNLRSAVDGDRGPRARLLRFLLMTP